MPPRDDALVVRLRLVASDSSIFSTFITAPGLETMMILFFWLGNKKNVVFFFGFLIGYLYLLFVYRAIPLQPAIASHLTSSSNRFRSLESR